jgi:hypothetical protein
MPTNKFSQNDASILAPYTRSVTITPSDSTDLAEVTRALYASKGSSSHCSVSVILGGDTDPITLELARGEIVPIRVKRVRVTNTDATSVIALY